MRLFGRALPFGLALLVATGVLFTSKPPAVRADPLPANPTMYVEPFCFAGVGLQNITVSGRNFAPGTQMIVTEYSHFGTFEGGWTVYATADEYGTFSVNMSFTTTTTAPNVRLDAVEYDAEKTWASAYVGGWARARS